MKKAFFCILLLLFCFVSFAQSSFSVNIMNGDLKMKEQFYEMALSFYSKALSAASSADEIDVAKQKIQECKNAMAPPLADSPVVSQKSKLLFSEQFLEMGHVYDEISETIVPYPYEDDYPVSLYQIVVYQDALVIVSHKDPVSSAEMTTVPAGTVIPLVEETTLYRVFSSGNEGEIFRVFKKGQGNLYGQNRIIFREQNDCSFVLYPMTLVKSQMDTFPSKTEEGAEVEKDNQSEGNRPNPVEIYPITFTENWQLNLDKDGQVLGDSRTAPLVAKDICCLMFRFRYTYQDSSAKSIRVDFKLLDSSGNLLLFPGEGTKSGYSSSKVLNPIPGGGILNIVVAPQSPGSITKGRYTISLWCENVEYYSVVIELE